MSQSFRAFRTDIEALRALAVSLVVLYHANNSLIPGGFLGVDIFFVISGYLITGLLVAEFDVKRRISFSDFYARRGRRLLPAALSVFVFTLFVGLFVFSPQEQLVFAKSAASSALYISNVFFALQPDGYFSQGVETNPFLHTWSLSVEEQFYLIWPALIFSSMTLARSRQALIYVLLAITLVSFGLCI